jgi:hypothetical protein
LMHFSIKTWMGQKMKQLNPLFWTKTQNRPNEDHISVTELESFTGNYLYSILI